MKNIISCMACGCEFKETHVLNFQNIKYCPFCGNEKSNNLSLFDSSNKLLKPCDELL